MKVFLYTDQGAEMLFESKDLASAVIDTIKSLKKENIYENYLDRFITSPKKYLKELSKKQLDRIDYNYQLVKGK